MENYEYMHMQFVSFVSMKHVTYLVGIYLIYYTIFLRSEKQAYSFGNASNELLELSRLPVNFRYTGVEV